MVGSTVLCDIDCRSFAAIERRFFPRGDLSDPKKQPAANNFALLCQTAEKRECFHLPVCLERDKKRFGGRQADKFGKDITLPPESVRWAAE